MSINPKYSSVRNRKIQKLESAASAVLLATAVFAAAPKGAEAFITITAGDQSWFDTANWARGNLTSTGTLPETVESVGPGNVSTDVYVDINAKNTVVPAVGVLFDPANDPLTPGGKNGNYLASLGSASNPTTFYVSDATGLVTSTTSSAPNKLTLESGTIQAWLSSIGRDGPGVMVQNGGVFMTTGEPFTVQSESNTETIGSGTFEYHGGTVIAGNQLQIASKNVGAQGGVSGVGVTSAGVGKFVVYNDGPDGAILTTNGLSVCRNNSGMGNIGIVEFHYDLDSENVGNIRPIQDNFNTTNGVLQLNNSSNTSARLNIVLDAVPSMNNGQVQNLGLFKSQFIDNVVSTSSAVFFSLDGLNAFTQGATIAAAYSGIAYSWTISYSGVISFDNSATSAYTSSDISALGGADVVLVGIPVPEPGSIALLGGAGSMILARRKRRKISV
jgi:hypothetical protein